MAKWGAIPVIENQHGIAELKEKLRIAEAALADVHREVEIFEAREAAEAEAEAREREAGLVARLQRILHRQG
jgi:sulfur relay (sulfurtransferase) complex TusBCD TusD component (DsrE family)